MFSEKQDITIKILLAIFIISLSFALLFVFYKNRFGDFASIYVVLSGIFASSLLLLHIRLKNLGISIVTVGACVIFIEFTLGVLFNSDANARIEGTYTDLDPAKRYWGRSELGHQPNPGVFTSRKFSSAGDIIYDVAYTIDEDRFRHTPKESAYASTPVFINFFGGSFLFGEGLNDNETLPYYVSQLLQVPVKNYGVHGYGVHEAHYILSHFELEAESQVNVLLTSAFHSERSFCVPTHSFLSPRYVIQDTKNGSQVVRDGVCRDPVFGELAPSWLVNVLSRFKLYSLFREAVILRRDREKEFKLYIELIKSMHGISKSQNKKFMVLYLNSEDDYFAASNYDNKLVIELLDQYGVHVIDASLADDGELQPRYYLHQEDLHPSALANQVRAHLLAAQLKPLLY